jgi:hypothetical protein
VRSNFFITTYIRLQKRKKKYTNIYLLQNKQSFLFLKLNIHLFFFYNEIVFLTILYLHRTFWQRRPNYLWFILPKSFGLWNLNKRISPLRLKRIQSIFVSNVSDSKKLRINPYHSVVQSSKFYESKLPFGDILVESCHLCNFKASYFLALLQKDKMSKILLYYLKSTSVNVAEMYILKIWGHFM